jgi:hypothetical protein
MYMYKQMLDYICVHMWMKPLGLSLFAVPVAVAVAGAGTCLLALLGTPHIHA